MSWTLQRYIIREIATPFALALGVLTLMLFAGGLLRLVEFLATRGVSPLQLALLLLYRLPYVLVFTIPMALLLAVLVTYLRLANDQELTALKAAGVSLYQTLPAPLLASALACALTLGLSLYGKPAGSHGFKKLLYEVARQRADLAFEEQTFSDAFDDLVVYVNRTPAPGRMEDIFIYDERDPDLPNSVLAARGEILSDPDRAALLLRLTNGTIYRVSPDYQVAEALRFERYDLGLDLEKLVGPYAGFRKGPSEMSLAELRHQAATSAEAARRHRLRMEIQRRFALPVACFVLGLVAVPLGATSRLERGTGVAFGLGVFLLYYLLLTAVWSASQAGTLPSWSVWLPNLAVGTLAAVLLRAAQGGRPLCGPWRRRAGQ